MNYRFLLTEVTTYSESNCVAGYLFKGKKFIGRKRLFLISSGMDYSIYPSKGRFKILEFLKILDWKRMEKEGINPNEKSESRKEKRQEDISVFEEDITSLRILENTDLRRFFQEIGPNSFDLKKFYSDFKKKESGKIFSKKELEFNEKKSLFYFSIPVDCADFKEIEKYKTKGVMEKYLIYEDAKFKIISSDRDIEFYKNKLEEGPEKIIACFGITQFFNCKESPENSGHYLLCNEVYFFDTCKASTF